MGINKEISKETARSCFRIAVVGTGGRAGSFLKYFSRNQDEGEIVGLCDKIPEKARLWAKLYKIQPKIFDDTEEMLSKSRPDALIVCTPDFAHVEPSVAALNASIHVLCEKPMATTLEDCSKIIVAAEKSSAIFYLGFNLRHNPTYNTVHQLVSSSQLGSISTIEANEYYYEGKTYFQRWNRLREFGGGLWVTKACHDFDILNWLAGCSAQNIYATAGLSHYRPKANAARRCRDCSLKFDCPDFDDISYTANNELEETRKLIRLAEEKKGGEPSDLCLYSSNKDTIDNGIAVINYKNGIRATYTLNVIAARTTRQLRIVGSEGMLEADLEKATIECTERHTRRKINYDLKEMSKGGHGGADDRMIKDFLKACHTGEKPKSSWNEGRLAVQVSLAARKSSDTGEVIHLDAPT